MGQPRTKKAKAHETTLQTTFVKRVKEELEARQLSVLGFSRLVGAPKERTLANVLYDGAVPRLTVIHQCAVALNVPVMDLLVDRPAKRQESVTNVRHLPPPYKPIFAAQHEVRTKSKVRKRNMPSK